MRLVTAVLVLAALAAGTVPAPAQTAHTGTLRIIVRDPSGAVIPNATVIL